MRVAYQSNNLGRLTLTVLKANSYMPRWPNPLVRWDRLVCLQMDNFRLHDEQMVIKENCLAFRFPFEIM
jgi:hypothetical protein